MRHQVENDVDAQRVGAGFGEYLEIDDMEPTGGDEGNRNQPVGL